MIIAIFVVEYRRRLRHFKCRNSVPTFAFAPTGCYTRIEFLVYHTLCVIMEKIRTAVIGAGYRGRYLISLLQHIDSFDIIAVSDISPKLPETIAQLFQGKVLPQIYHSGTDDYLRMLDETKPDLVIIASPWHLHKAQAINALRAGCHVAIEVKGALDNDEYPDIIAQSRQSGKEVFPLENTLFRDDILAINNMVQAGVFGQLVFLQGGYRHDLTYILVDNEGNFGPKNGSESEWRSHYYETENGDLYPTHGLAPLCMFLGVNRTDHIKTIASFSTAPGVGLRACIARRKGADCDEAHRTFEMGDVVTSILQTDSGAQITLLHDTTLPRPRSLNYEVQGTKGIWNAEKKAIYIDGVSPSEDWEPEEKYIQQYKHRFWQRWEKEALLYDGHHQGMDYIMLKALGEALLGRESYPATLADMATWAAVTPRSKESIKQNRPVPFPRY